MIRTLKRQFLWVLYAVFVVIAVTTHSGEPVFRATGPYAAGKYVVWAIFFLFLAYSIYCSTQASFIKSLPKINKHIWARQIGLDLYISVFLSLALIYFVEGSMLIVLLWFAPVVIFANLAILLYIALNYSEIVSHFVN